MSTSGIHFSGISSGLDVDSIISSLMTIEGLPVQRMQKTQAGLQAQQAALSSFRSQLQSVASSVAALATKATYNPVSATSSDTAVATVTANSNANAGNFTLEIANLAQGHKLASSGQSSATNALGYSGQVSVNGKALTVSSGDSLNAIASRISGLGVGVSASVIDGGSGQAYISLTSQNTGKDNAIQLADVSGNVLSSLGLVTGANALRNSPSANTALSVGFSDATTKLTSLTGINASGTLTLNGTDVAIDFANDSLQGVADKINAGATGIAATVVSATQNGKTVQKLQLSGNGVPSGISDPNGVLNAIGVFQKGFGNELTQAKDASYKIDGLQLTSASNTITSVVPGATITLLKGSSTATVNLSRDISQIKSAITSFQTAYNNMANMVKSATKYDKDSGSTGVLFGDQNVQAIQQSLTNLITSTQNSGKYTNLTQIGFSLSQDGTMAIDDSKLSDALNNNLNDVKDLLMATGSASDASLSYVGSTENTKGTNGTYAVNITQVATKSRATGNMAQTSVTGTGESLTFSGQLFGSSKPVLVLDAGMSATDIAAKINGDSRFKDLVTASIDQDGKLQIDSKRYGTSGRFSVSSNKAAASDNSGIGTLAAIVDGKDVAGTINGETATGSGQYLLGSVGNKTTSGLQIQYTGTSTGQVGNIYFNQGAANTFRSKISSILDSVNGQLTIQDKSLQKQVDDLSDTIKDAQTALGVKEKFYRNKFTAMESALSKLQSQSSQLVTSSSK